MQEGRFVAANVMRAIQKQPLQSFRYIDKGSMAIVGRHSAVAQAFGMTWSGPIAWFLWLVVHVYYLIGFRNRLMVLFSWAYNYLTYDRSTRAILTVAKSHAVTEIQDTQPSAAQLPNMKTSEPVAPERPAAQAVGASKA